MQDATHQDKVEGTGAAPPETSTSASEHAQIQAYLDYSIKLADPLEGTLNVLNAKLAQHLLWLESDLDAVRSSLPDPQERLAVDLETTKSVSRIVEAVTDQSEIVVRLKRRREKNNPQPSDQADRARSTSPTATKSRRPK